MGRLLKYSNLGGIVYHIPLEINSNGEYCQSVREARQLTTLVCLVTDPVGSKLGGGGETHTWYLCGRLRFPSFLWLIFTKPGKRSDSVIHLLDPLLVPRFEPASRTIWVCHLLQSEEMIRCPIQKLVFATHMQHQCWETNLRAWVSYQLTFPMFLWGNLLINYPGPAAVSRLTPNCILIHFPVEMLQTILHYS